MLDFDAGKLLIVGMVALVVIGPKDLPRVLRQFGQAVGKLRRMAGEFQGQFMEAVREADLQDLRQEVAKLKDTASLDVHFDPARDVKNELTRAINQPVSRDPIALAAASEPVVEASSSGASAEHEISGALASLDRDPVPLAAPVISEPFAIPPQPAIDDAAPREPPETPRRKIAPSRRRDGSRIDPVATRERGAGFAPPRPRPPRDRDHLDR